MSMQLNRLANGLTVVTQRVAAAETAAIALLADAGSRNEAATENGLAHFFEHMVFKGTGQHSARAIAESIENVGGTLNAWTSRDATCFHARVLAKDAGLATALVAELVTAPLFAAADIALEKQVVLSEIGEYLETPDELVFDLLQASAFPEQSLGRPILGTADSLAGFDGAALTSWRDRMYRGDGLVLAATGNIDHDQLLDSAEQLLGALPGGRPEAPMPARWQGGTAFRERDTEQLHLTLGFRGFAVTDPREMAARLFATAVGGGMSSRLFQQLREERGLAYSIGAAHGLHADTGLFSIYAATRPEDGAQVLAESRAIAAQAAADLAAAELDRARAQLKAGILMALESHAAQAEWLAGSLLSWGRVLPHAELVARIETPTLEDVRAAGTLLLDSPPAIAAVGPGAGRMVAA